MGASPVSGGGGGPTPRNAPTQNPTAPSNLPRCPTKARRGIRNRTFNGCRGIVAPMISPRQSTRSGRRSNSIRLNRVRYRATREGDVPRSPGSTFLPDRRRPRPGLAEWNRSPPPVVRAAPRTGYRETAPLPRTPARAGRESHPESSGVLAPKPTLRPQPTPSPGRIGRVAIASPVPPPRRGAIGARPLGRARRGGLPHARSPCPAWLPAAS